MAVNLAGWLSALQSLLPPGRAMTREPDSNMAKLLSILAASLVAAQLWLEDLLYQADPRNATTLLTDWERLLGLPDACRPEVQTLVDRQLAAYQRLVEQGGQSRAYFIELAAALGEPGCTITEFRPMNCNDHCNSALGSEADRFFWSLNIPHAPQDLRPMNCNDHCNSALQVYTPSLAECPVSERKPAHTQVFFTYST